jgi:hypothetical protein
VAAILTTILFLLIYVMPVGCEVVYMQCDVYVMLQPLIIQYLIIYITINRCHEPVRTVRNAWLLDYLSHC